MLLRSKPQAFPLIKRSGLQAVGITDLCPAVLSVSRLRSFSFLSDGLWLLGVCQSDFLFAVLHRIQDRMEARQALSPPSDSSSPLCGI